MAIQISAAAANAYIDVLVDLIDATGAALFYMYTGERPASPDDTPTGTLLCAVELNEPSFSEAADGVATMNVSTAPHGVAVATGTIGWYRITDAEGTGVIDGLAEDMDISSLDVTTGATVTLNSGTLQPDGWS
jgi:hypothetical protein